AWQGAGVRRVYGLLELPTGKVGQAKVVSLAGPYRGVEERQGFLDGRVWVPGVHLVEVDRFNPQAAEAGVEGAGQVTARQPDLVGIGTGGETSLGGEHDPLTTLGCPVGQPPTD